MVADNYCIRPDYKAHAVNASFDVAGSNFWTTKRLSQSREYQWHVYSVASALVKSERMHRVLDIGCGPAVKLMEHIAPLAEVTGIDQPSAVAFSRAHYPGGSFFADNFEQPALDLDGHFDLIICSDVIEHMADPDQLLTYIARFAGPKTQCLISTPDRDRFRGRHCLVSPNPVHAREWNASEFCRYLTTRGFRVLEHLHLPPVRTAPGRLMLAHLVNQWLHLRPYRYNQLVRCQLI